MPTNATLPEQEPAPSAPLLTLVIVTSTLTMTLMTLAVVARLAAKIFVFKKVHLEDCQLQMDVS